MSPVNIVVGLISSFNSKIRVIGIAIGSHFNDPELSIFFIFYIFDIFALEDI